MRILLLVFFCFCSSNLLAAQLSWKVKSSGVTQFNPFYLEVVYIGPKEKLPPLVTPDHLGKPFQLLAVTSQVIGPVEGGVKRRVTYQILPLRAGNQVLLPLTQGELATTKLEFLVHESASKITAPKLTPPPSPPFLWWPLFIATALIPILYFWMARAKQEMLEGTTLVSAKEKALGKLKTLAGASYIQDAKWDAFYSELSWIFREFVEAEYKIKALELTTSEFLSLAAQKNLFTAQEKEGLSHFLSFSDLVKFAQARAGEVAATQAVNEVKAFIEGKTGGI